MPVTIQSTVPGDPRYRRALARVRTLPSPLPADERADAALYWLVRSHRPRRTAVLGDPAPVSLLHVAQAMADGGQGHIIRPVKRSRAPSLLELLNQAGLDWLLRSEQCLACADRCLRPDLLVCFDDVDALGAELPRLAANGMIVLLSRGGRAGREAATRLASLAPGLTTGTIGGARVRVIVAMSKGH